MYQQNKITRTPQCRTCARQTVPPQLQSPPSRCVRCDDHHLNTSKCRHHHLNASNALQWGRKSVSEKVHLAVQLSSWLAGWLAGCHVISLVSKSLFGNRPCGKYSKHLTLFMCIAKMLPLPPIGVQSWHVKALELGVDLTPMSEAIEGLCIAHCIGAGSI